MNKLSFFLINEIPQDSGPIECFRNVGQWTLSPVWAENIWSPEEVNQRLSLGSSHPENKEIDKVIGKTQQ